MYLSPGSPELAQAAHALELATRDHLKSLRDENFHWLLVCTFAVGAGLLMELPEIVHDMCEIYGRKSRELKYWLTPSMDRREYPRRDWVKKWAAIGWVLIVLGVLGEGWFEERVSKYDTALSNMTDAVVAKAQEESANAEATAKGFDAKISESNAKAASAEATAEAERLARVKIEAAVAFRSLDEQQKRDFGAALATFSSGRTLAGASIWYASGSVETELFADDIAEALRSAHIHTTAPGGMMLAHEGGKWDGPMGKVDTGVKVTSTQNPVAREFADAVTKELNNRGFTSRRTPDELPKDGNPQGPVIWITVDARPKGAQGEFKLQAEREAKAKSSTTKKP